MRFEIRDNSLANALGHFAIANAEQTFNEDHMFRLDLGDTYDDESRIRIGTGQTDLSFTFEGETFAYSRLRNGDAVCSTSHNLECSFPELIVLTAPSLVSAREVCKKAIKLDEDLTRKDHFRLYVWDAAGEHWRRRNFVPNRTWDSVILSDSVATELKEDLDAFFEEEVCQWYAKHGVKYKRGILFHGPPGTGKTSMIAAIATRHGRSVFRINLVAPRLTDDSLHDAISSVKEGSIIVMEDVDCLFDTMRGKKEDFNVTFSGLLNAIDGLADSKGSIFIFTSNHPDRLDDAMRRHGRIDKEYEFGFANSKQARDMFLRFYPGEKQYANEFAQHLKGKMFTPSALQEHFVICRKISAKDAVILKVEETKPSLNMWT